MTQQTETSVTQLAVIDPKEYGLAESQANEVQAAFMPKIKERDGLAEIYGTLIKQEITHALCTQAGDVRRKLVKVRTGIAEIHKTQKAFYLAAGRYVDAWKNKETAPVLQMESTLEEIETHYERIEAEKKAQLQADRAAEVAKYQQEGDFVPANLGDLTPEVYANYLLGVKTAYDLRIAAAETARKIEEERIRLDGVERTRHEQAMQYRQFWSTDRYDFRGMSDGNFDSVMSDMKKAKQDYEKKQAAIEAENKRLKKEADELAAKAEAERKAREEADRIAREKHEAELKAEREERERIQRELAAKAEAERAAEAERERQLQAELSKGDAEKVNDLIRDLEALKTKYTFQSKKNREMYANVSVLLEKAVTYVKQK